MTDFTITNTGTATGTGGADKLTYTVTVAGGVTLTGMTGNASGYAGTFNGPGTNDGSFTAIEQFEFNDNIGGADNITTGDNADTINGGAGNDTLSGAGGADTINAGDGNDSVLGGDGNDTLTSGAGSDSLYGGNNDDTINLTIDGNDVIDGGANTDTLVVTGASGFTLTTSAISGAGTATITGIEKFNVTGSSSADNITTGTGNDTINSGAGDDTISGGTGADTINAGLGNDRIVVTLDANTDTIDGGGDFDTLVISAGAALNIAATSASSAGGTISGAGSVSYANIERLDVTASGANDTINAGSGSDRITTGAGSDSVHAGDGDDRVTLTVDGADTVNGGNGADTLVANIGGATAINVTTSGITRGGDTVAVSGFEQFDLTLSSGNDTVALGSGNDTVYGGQGADNIDMGAGADFIQLTGSFDDTVVGGAGVDTLRGLFGADVVARTLSADALGVEILDLTMGSGADSVTTAASTSVVGNDYIDGGNGNDTIQVYLGGVDTIVGGGGTDVLRLVNDRAGTSVEITDLIFSGGSYSGTVLVSGGHSVTFSGIEVIEFTDNVNGDDTIRGVNVTNGSGGNDMIDGTAANDTLPGGAGDDVINGLGGNDLITGLAGKDTLYGGDGDDNLNGGAEADRLFGDAGNDTLLLGTGDIGYGGAGNDILEGSAADDKLYGGDNNDFLNSASGKDTVDGGAGVDTWTADLSDVTKSQYLNFSAGRSDNVVSETGIDIRNIEVLNLTLGAGNDRILLNRSNLANDILNMGAGRDSATNGLSGTDAINGGSGVDTGTIYGPSTTAVSSTFSGSGASYQVVFTGVNGVTTFTNFERIYFRGAGSSNDNIATGASTDFIYAVGGNDTISTGAGSDHLYGGEGNDVLIGGGATDYFYGGNGVDSFVFNATSGKSDIVYDYVDGTDKFVIEIGGGVSAFGDLEIKNLTNGRDVRVQVGDDASFIIRDTLKAELQAGDFIFV